MPIDLHAHSICSDGTDTPAELVRAAVDAGLDVVALTDHDTTHGWVEAAQAARSMGITLVRGLEVSTKVQEVSVHLLAYLADPTAPGLSSEIEKARTSRITRAERMVERIQADYDLDWSDVVQGVAPGATIGRPHIADALVRRGIVPDRSAAFEHILRSNGPYWVGHYAPDPVDAVRLVLEAGGVPVMAHPFAAARGQVVDDSVIEQMADAGLVGLEADHRDHTPEQRDHARDLARRLGLITTGSSDYHGTGKPNRLGENTTTPESFEAIAAAATSDIPVLAP